MPLNALLRLVFAHPQIDLNQLNSTYLHVQFTISATTAIKYCLLQPTLSDFLDGVQIDWYIRVY